MNGKWCDVKGVKTVVPFGFNNSCLKAWECSLTDGCVTGVWRYP